MCYAVVDDRSRWVSVTEELSHFVPHWDSVNTSWPGGDPGRDAFPNLDEGLVGDGSRREHHQTRSPREEVCHAC